MKLAHYTSPLHLPHIEASGVIRVTESNISLQREHAGPDVVWLTTDWRWPELPEGVDPLAVVHNGLSAAKTLVRITVDVTDFLPWHRFAMREQMPLKERFVFIEAAGTGSYQKWYVVEREIPREQWVDIDVRKDHPLYDQIMAVK